MLKEQALVFRQYQQDILSKLGYKNSLIVIPTSLGKTIVTLLICLDFLLNWKKSKILILAPTRPLVHQHLELFKRFTIFPDQCFALTGKISTDIRGSLWHSNSIRVYFATPELVRNDMMNNLLKKTDFYLIVFDEAHRAVKEYSYTYISKKFYENLDCNKNPLFLALSASPGADKEIVHDICSNLFVEQIIVKSEKDEDVLPYVYHVDVEPCIIELNDYHKEISKILDSIIQEKVGWLIKNKFIRKKKIDNVYRKDLLSLAEFIKSKIDDKNNINPLILAALKYQSMSMILLYCRDLVESQGSFALKKFFRKVENESSSKTYQELLTDLRIQRILIKLQDHDNNADHPKLEKLLCIISDFLTITTTTTRYPDKRLRMKDFQNTSTAFKNGQPDYSSGDIYYKKKVLIFSQYRDTVDQIVCLLNNKGIFCKGFYGQSKKDNQKGLSQDKQLSILNDFRQGVFPVLVATSVGEEGLDIPNVDLVLFYEPVPSAIRFIQRKGRTGRFSDGKVIILISNNTIDSKYFEISKRKVDKMKHNLLETNFVLGNYVKRNFKLFEKMSDYEIKSLENKFISNRDQDIYSPIMGSISSNSNRQIKHMVKKLSYQSRIAHSSNTDVDKLGQSSFKHVSNDTLKDLYEISLSLDKKKIVGRAQRQIHDLLAKAGVKGLEISYLKEMLNFDNDIFEKALENLERIKRIVWLNTHTIGLVDSVKFILGKKYSIYVENILLGKSIVRVNEKWFAFLDHYDYTGPRSLLKKGSTFDVIGEMYRKNGKLHLAIKKIL